MKRRRPVGWTPPRGGADTPDTIDAVSDADSPPARDALSCEALEPTKTAPLPLDDLRACAAAGPDRLKSCAGLGFGLIGKVRVRVS